MCLHDNSFNFNKAALHTLLTCLHESKPNERAEESSLSKREVQTDFQQDSTIISLQRWLRWCTPLMLKMSCLGTEPLGFKGGKLVHLYKGKGPADEP